MFGKLQRDFKDHVVVSQRLAFRIGQKTTRRQLLAEDERRVMLVESLLSEPMNRIDNARDELTIGAMSSNAIKPVIQRWITRRNGCRVGSAGGRAKLRLRPK